MSMRNAYCGGLILALSVLSCVASAQTKFNIGKPATEQEVKGWDIDVSPSGAGLPAGSGSVARGGVCMRKNVPPATAPKARVNRRIVWSAGRAH